MLRIFTCFALLFFSSFMCTYAAEDSRTVGGYGVEKALRLGERMYRQGLLPSGEPMEAIVQGDIPVDGSMFTCESCHLRSGLGSVEGTVITLPTNGSDLYRDYPRGSEVIRPMRKMFADEFQKDYLRPAYTDESLAEALALGVDSSGRDLDPIMPRYALEDPDMEILIFYLKRLSTEFSPGVDEETIHFATVITDDVPKDKQDAMLRVLETYIRDKNTQSRQQERRAKEGIFYRLEFYTAYRKIDLKKWLLHGEPETWQSQLEQYYKKEPVFALIGGISTKEWKPIHSFCEKEKIPCLFPMTDFPVISDSDWYTFYFSKGYFQEGEAAARYLRRNETKKHSTVLQVFRDNQEGRSLANGYQQTRKLLKQPAPQNKILQPGEIINATFWAGLLAEFQPDILFLWLPAEDLQTLEVLASSAHRPQQIFVSYGQLDESVYALPESVRDFTYITYPYALPQKSKRERLALKSWLKVKKIPLTDPMLQGKVFFLGRMLTASLMDMRRDFYRDRFFEGIDMMVDQDYTIPTYPKLSFGPSQRYASKGCYIVQLTKGPEPRLETKSNWVNH
ncbi:MAG: ABC transporter substrate-binding protein [Desulfobulbaceae bacterium]|nr:ABC transporter substrate-binding protein [Desulfobulbaceae bacterium]